MAFKQHRLFQGEEQRLALLDQRLQALHGNLTGAQPLGEPTEHLATFKDWKLILESSPEGQLIAASMARCGSETYAFERTGNSEWAAPTAQSLFPNAQFYNLVHMATQAGLAWTERPGITAEA